MSERLITIGQLSDETGIGPRDLAEDAAEGRLPAHRVGGRWVIDREEIEEYLREVADGDDDLDDDLDDDDLDDDEERD
jgi:excisionase family DNA binding protein